MGERDGARPPPGRASETDCEPPRVEGSVKTSEASEFWVCLVGRPGLAWRPAREEGGWLHTPARPTPDTRRRRPSDAGPGVRGGEWALLALRCAALPCRCGRPARPRAARCSGDPNTAQAGCRQRTGCSRRWLSARPGPEPAPLARVNECIKQPSVVRPSVRARRAGCHSVQDGGDSVANHPAPPSPPGRVTPPRTPSIGAWRGGVSAAPYFSPPPVGDAGCHF